jgi:hypothetical protein
MNVLRAARMLWRYKFFTVPIILLTLAAVGYVALLTPGLYEAESSYVLFSPPAPPTKDDIAADPALAKVHADNPYARFDPSVVSGIIADRVNSDRVRTRLVAAGADDGYTVTTSGQYGNASPTAQIQAQGSTPAGALRTVQMVGKAYRDELRTVQAAQGVDGDYMITATEVGEPDGAHARVSNRLRSMLAILGAGALLLFLSVSIAEAVQALRHEASTKSPSPLVVVPGIVWSDRNEARDAQGR